MDVIIKPSKSIKKFFAKRYKYELPKYNLIATLLCCVSLVTMITIFAKMLLGWRGMGYGEFIIMLAAFYIYVLTRHLTSHKAMNNLFWQIGEFIYAKFIKVIVDGRKKTLERNATMQNIIKEYHTNVLNGDKDPMQSILSKHENRVALESFKSELGGNEWERIRNTAKNLARKADKKPIKSKAYYYKSIEDIDKLALIATTTFLQRFLSKRQKFPA